MALVVYLQKFYKSVSVDWLTRW